MGHETERSDHTVHGPRHPYQPNYASSPGEVLLEYLEEHDISARELARRCGRSPKLMAEILSARAALEPETALQLEHVLGVPASMWLGMEAEYRLHLARIEDDDALAKWKDWAEHFPLDELEKRGLLPRAKDPADRVRSLLRFFGVGSVSACQDKFDEMMDVAFRHSPAFESNREALLAWLRIGELLAEKIECADYDRAVFVESLKYIRSLTVLPINRFLPEITERCARAGVAFVVERPLSNVALSGISRWRRPNKPLIQQTLRHLSNDHFWFTFFHECAHLLLHSRKSVFIDGKGFGNATEREEQEANEWAANFLVPQNAMTRFITRFNYRISEVIEFAKEQGVAPGIVVGQLQHRKVLKFNQMNQLRERFEWKD
jgi:HTH-type transcriptional regulator / antitoxin HigA